MTVIKTKFQINLTACIIKPTSTEYNTKVWLSSYIMYSWSVADVYPLKFVQREILSGQMFGGLSY